MGTEKNFSWIDYKYGTEYNLTKYNATDDKTVLDPEDDAATVNMGAKWSMPTEEQFIELLKETVAQLVFSDGTKANVDANNSDPENGYIAWNEDEFPIGKGIAGMKFTSKKDPAKELFFPISGSLSDGRADYVSSAGFSWLISCQQSTADVLCFDDSGAGNFLIYSSLYRRVGLPVRGVVSGSSIS